MDIDPLALLDRLVRIDSTSGTPGEREALEAISGTFADAPASTVQWADDGAGLVIVPAATTERPLLVFACHADVVPVDSPAAWSTPPFDPVERDGRIHGRGSSDMKSGIAAAAAAVSRLHGAGAPVALAVSLGEEIGCVGAPAVARALAADAVGAMIVPESTGNRIALGHRGAFWLAVRTAGVAAHGSTPERGENAILKMARVLARVGDLPLREHPYLGRESLNVGVIRAGTVPNIVPDACEIRVDQRVVDADVEDIHRWWASQPEVESVEVERQLGPVATDPADPWVTSLPAEPAAGPVSYFTDASVFARTPGFSAPVVIWGPGDPTVVHSVDESVEVSAVLEAARAFEAAGTAWAAR